MSRPTISYEDNHVFEFTPGMEPAYSARSGETLTIETIDGLSGAIQTNDDLLEAMPEEVNAATGPIEVRAATPGDVLKIEIEDVRITEEYGRVLTTPGFGLLHDEESIDHPFTRITPIEGDTVVFEGIEVDIRPVIGTIGVAPAEESYTTLVPHDHGGNLDTTDMTAGTTAYFPVFQDGAMLAMGDSKAVMADGEMCGTGAEISTEIDITVDVIEDPPIPVRRPLVETDESWKTIASARTVERAAKLANYDMLGPLEREHGFQTAEAYLFSSLVGGLEVSQVVDPLVTVRNAIPKEYLSNPFQCRRRRIT